MKKGVREADSSLLLSSNLEMSIIRPSGHSGGGERCSLLSKQELRVPPSCSLKYRHSGVCVHPTNFHRATFYQIDILNTATCSVEM